MSGSHFWMRCGWAARPGRRQYWPQQRRRYHGHTRCISKRLHPVRISTLRERFPQWKSPRLGAYHSVLLAGFVLLCPGTVFPSTRGNPGVFTPSFYCRSPSFRSSRLFLPRLPFHWPHLAALRWLSRGSIRCPWRPSRGRIFLLGLLSHRRRLVLLLRCMRLLPLLRMTLPQLLLHRKRLGRVARRHFAWLRRSTFRIWAPLFHRPAQSRSPRLR